MSSDLSKASRQRLAYALIALGAAVGLVSLALAIGAIWTRGALSDSLAGTAMLLFVVSTGTFGAAGIVWP